MKKDIKAILVSGHARNGKDTFCNILNEINPIFQPMALAYELKLVLSPLIEENFGWDIFNLNDEQKRIVRPIMIAFGCAMREVDIDYWAKKVEKAIDTEIGEPFVPVISDCRFLSEYEFFKNKYGADSVILVEVIRKGAPTPPEEELKNQPLLKPHIDYEVYWPTFAPHEKDECKKYVQEFYDKFLKNE